jgi:hypothetical protein
MLQESRLSRMALQSPFQASGSNYKIEYRDDMTNGAWLPAETITATSTQTTWPDDGSKTGDLSSKRFYRVIYSRSEIRGLPKDAKEFKAVAERAAKTAQTRRDIRAAGKLLRIAYGVALKRFWQVAVGNDLEDESSRDQNTAMLVCQERHWSLYLLRYRGRC